MTWYYINVRSRSQPVFSHHTYWLWRWYKVHSACTYALTYRIYTPVLYRYVNTINTRFKYCIVWLSPGTEYVLNCLTHWHVWWISILCVRCWPCSGLFVSSMLPVYIVVHGTLYINCTVIIVSCSMSSTSIAWGSNAILWRQCALIKISVGLKNFWSLTHDGVCQ